MQEWVYGCGGCVGAAPTVRARASSLASLVSSRPYRLVFALLTSLFFLSGAQLAKRVLVRLMHGRSDGKMLREGFDRWRAQHRMAVVAFDAACAQEELEQELEVGG